MVPANVHTPIDIAQQTAGVVCLCDELWEHELNTLLALGGMRSLRKQTGIAHKIVHLERRPCSSGRRG